MSMLGEGEVEQSGEAESEDKTSFTQGEMTRRHFLKVAGLAGAAVGVGMGAGLGGLLAAGGGEAEAWPGSTPKMYATTTTTTVPTTASVPVIDVHSHYMPAKYIKALVDAGRSKIDMLTPPSWDLNKHLEDMDKMNIGASVLSVSSPDLNWGDNALAATLARDANEVGAAFVRDHPKRLGFFASLPMPDVDGSLAEIEYAFDTLHADGVHVYTNSNGVYLGDPKLEPVFSELNRRNAVVLVHPVKPSSVPSGVLTNMPFPSVEFMFDTTRAIYNLNFAGTLKRNPQIKLICPHLGALISLLAGRLMTQEAMMRAYKLIPEDYIYPDIKAELANLYYDWAGMTFPQAQIPALLTIGRTDRMLCGVDYPHTPIAVAAPMLDRMRNTELVPKDQLMGILRTNALKLFPRLA